MGISLGSGFLTRGCLFFNNLEEVELRHGSTHGVAGFRLYVSPVAIQEFGGQREQHKR